MLTALVSCVVVEPSNAVDVILSINGVTLFGGKLGSVKVPPVPAKENIGQQYLIGISPCRRQKFHHVAKVAAKECVGRIKLVILTTAQSISIMMMSGVYTSCVMCRQLVVLRNTNDLQTYSLPFSLMHFT